jgi:hypothetical protein
LLKSKIFGPCDRISKRLIDNLVKSTSLKILDADVVDFNPTISPRGSLIIMGMKNGDSLTVFTTDHFNRWPEIVIATRENNCIAGRRCVVTLLEFWGRSPWWHERISDHSNGNVRVGPLLDSPLLPVLLVVSFDDQDRPAGAMLQCREPQTSTLDFAGAHFGVFVDA